MPLVKNKKGEHIVEISNLGEVSVTTDGLEALQTTANTKLTSIDTRLDECIGHTNNTTAMGDGSNQLRSVMLGYDRANGKARSLLVDSGGKLECSVSDLEVTMQNVNLNTDTLETKIQSIDTRLENSIGAVNNTDSIGDGSNQLRSVMLGYDRANGKARSLLVDSDGHQQIDIVSTALPTGSATSANQVIIEASLTAMEAKMDVDNAVYDNQLTKLTEIDTAIDTIDTVLDASLVKQTNIETLITTLDGVQDNALTKLTEIDTAIDTIDTVLDASLVKQTNNETLLTSIDQKLGDIETAVQILDNAISGNEMQVDIVSIPTTTVSGTVTANLSATDNAVLDAIETTNNAIQSAVEGTLTVGSHHVTNAGTFATQAVCSGTVTANLGATDNAVLDDIAQKLGDIETAVQILDNAISGNEMQVDVISMPSTTVSGTVTANLSATDNAVLDASLVKQTNIETLITTLDGVQDNILTKLGEIETTNNAVQVAVEGTLTVGSHAVTNAGTFATQAVCSGTVTANLGATDNAVLDDIAQKLGDIETAVQILDNAISGNEMQVDVISMPSTTVSGTVTANLSATDNAVLDASLVKQTNIETLLTAIDSDTNNIKTSTASCATDLAALEVLQTSTNSKIDTFDAVLDASLVKQTNIETLITTLDGVQDNVLTKITNNETLLTAIDSDTNNIKNSTASMVTDLAALEVLNTSILAKIQPTRDVVTIFNNASLGADATLPSSEIDMLNFRHIRIVGFSDEDDKTGQVQIWGSTSSGGTYFDMGFSSANYSSSVILVPTIENIPVRYIKLVVTDQTGGSSNLNVYGFRLN